MCPLKLPDDESSQFFIFGRDAKGAIGATLATGATIAVTSADPATVDVELDATPEPAPAGLLDNSQQPVPVGTPSIASGTVTSTASPANPNTPVLITAQITNADQTPGASASDTCTVVPGLENSIGMLFAGAQPMPAPVPPAPASHK